MSERVPLAWSHGRVEVSTLAGMLVEGVFVLDGREFSPFATAPWTEEEASDPAFPGHLRVLGGEFACVPFGSSVIPMGTSGRWDSRIPPNHPQHGLSSEVEWTIESVGPNEVALSLDYPGDSLVSRVERTIRGVPGSPRIEFELVVHARRAGATSLGLHPILRMPERAGSLRIDARFDRGRTYPMRADPSAVTITDSWFDALAAVPGIGGDVDLSVLPSGAPMEEIVQLCAVTPPLRATWLDENAAIELDWSSDVLPHVLMWISDGALQEEPFSGRYHGLGVEPVASAFDLPSELSVGPNPLSDAGYQTSVELRPDRPLRITSTISAFRSDESAHTAQ